MLWLSMTILRHNLMINITIFIQLLVQINIKLIYLGVHLIRFVYIMSDNHKQNKMSHIYIFYSLINKLKH